MKILSYERKINISLFTALFVLLSFTVISCSSYKPTPTPAPLLINNESLWGDVIEQFSTSESNCLKSALGQDVYKILLHEKVIGSLRYPLLLKTECVNSSTASKLVIESLDAQAKGLSSNTKQCLEGIFTQIPINDLSLLTYEQTDIAVTDYSAAISNALGLLLCLDQADAAKLTTGRLLGSKIPDISFAKLQCVLEYTEVSELIAFLNSANEVTYPSDEFQSALGKCEINVI